MASSAVSVPMRSPSTPGPTASMATTPAPAGMPQVHSPGPMGVPQVQTPGPLGSVQASPPSARGSLARPSPGLPAPDAALAPASPEPRPSETRVLSEAASRERARAELRAEQEECAKLRQELAQLDAAEAGELQSQPRAAPSCPEEEVRAWQEKAQEAARESAAKDRRVSALEAEVEETRARLAQLEALVSSSSRFSNSDCA